MQDLTPEGTRVVEDVARRNGFSTDAAITLLRALWAGRGSMAQFSHPELGGMGQWTRGGMIMIGDMFNNALKARVDVVCSELAALLDRPDLFAAPRREAPSQYQGQSSGGASAGGFGRSDWWPAELGTPSSAGAQNDVQYAYFPATRRLAVDRNGQMTVYDTGDHVVTGVSQQQGGGQSLTFTSQFGTVRLENLPVVSGEEAALPEKQGAAPAPADFSAAASPLPGAPVSSATSGDLLATLEKLADLHQKGILSSEEFAAKKAELLSRL